MSSLTFETTVRALEQSILAPQVYVPPIETVDLAVEDVFPDGGTALKTLAMRRFGWSPSLTQRVYEEYKKFLALKAAVKDWTCDLLSAPPLIDRLWRLHSLTHEYYSLCVQTFGFVIEHDKDTSLARRFAAAAAVRARYGIAFDETVWTFGPIARDDDAGEPASKRRRRSTLTVRIQDQTHEDIYFRLRDTTSLDKLQASYARRMRVTVCLQYHGLPVRPGQTPKSLRMNDGDVLVAVPQTA